MAWAYSRECINILEKLKLQYLMVASATSEVANIHGVESRRVIFKDLWNSSGQT